MLSRRLKIKTQANRTVRVHNNSESSGKMIRVIQDGPTITLNQALDNREWRSHRQTQLAKRYPTAVVVSVKLNIPGPIKTSRPLQDLFRRGLGCLRQYVADFPLIDDQILLTRPTGPEAFLVIQGTLTAVKRQAIAFESATVMGRLFDIDTLQAGVATQLSRQDLGYAPRQCLICDQPAKVCIKTSAHQLQAGYQAIQAIYDATMQDAMVIAKPTQAAVVHAAMAGLLYEVSLQPKPGLVDPISPGAHDDMTVMTFIDSSLALMGYFNTAFTIGHDFSGDDLTAMFQTLRVAGREAEQAMFAATHGVNTHKGAIFSLGIMVTAVAYATRLTGTTTAHLQEIMTHMLTGLVAQDLTALAANQKPLTAGEQQYQQYRLTGVRGEAAAGFPVVLHTALPFLQSTTGQTTQRLLDTLMQIAGAIEDTNLIKRAGTPAITAEMQQWVRDYFARGGSKTPAGLAYLTALDDQFIARHLSIGGAADNLILTIFLAKLGGVLV